jgi:membrane protein YdbS with pleckstrin-like domain
MHGTAHAVPLQPAEPLDPRVVRLWSWYWHLATLVVLALAAGAGVLVTVLADGAVVWGTWVVAAAAVGTCAAGARAWPRRAYRYHRWEVRPEGVLVQEGVLRRTLHVVPHGRIQAVDCSSGPLERRLGLSTLHLRTASDEGSPSIPGLGAVRAAALAAAIAARARREDGT